MHRFLLAILVSVLFWPIVGQGVTPQNFEVETTKDLITLCSVTENDINAIEAIHFCHGFIIGAYHYYVASTEPPGVKEFVCLPDPPPSRNQGIAEFVAWAKDNPKHMNKEAVNTLFRYLEKKYPCPE
jgi:hypothetical protein